VRRSIFRMAFLAPGLLAIIVQLSGDRPEFTGPRS
jgi:hypothetical protein